MCTVEVELRQSINGIFNALLASLIINHLPTGKILRRSRAAGAISLHETLFNILVALVILPSLLIMVENSRKGAENIEADVAEDIRDRPGTSRACWAPGTSTV